MAKGTDFDWDDLRYFLRAVQAGSLAGAARSMGVEHTTIGRRLSALERSLGAPLVLRGPEGLQLTPLGKKLVPLAQGIERAVRAVGDAVASQGSRVRLAVPSGFTKLFVERMAELRALDPGVSLEILSGARPVDLKKGEADLAIRSGPVTDKELVSRKLCDTSFSLYASEAYLARRPEPIDPGALDGLGGHEIIGFDPALAAVPAARWIEEHAARATIVLRSREMTDMLTAAVSGVGLALLPCLLADVEPALRRLTPAVFATRTLSLVYRPEARLSEHVRAVIRFVAAVIKDNAERIGGLRRPR